MSGRNIPPGYVEAVRLVEYAILSVLRKGGKPSFRMPPDEAFVIVPLDYIYRRLALNAEAVAICQAVAGENKDVTLEQLRVALKLCEVPYTTVTFQELGIGPGGKLS